MTEEAREDAKVIPIGTGGRPGRGSGSARPSSAARNLAPAAKKPAARKAPKPAATKKGAGFGAFSAAAMAGRSRA